jgi:hypothetical protein
MSRLLIILLLLLAGVTAVTVAAFKLLGWWSVIVIPVVAIVFLKFVAGRLLKRVFLMPFKAKGAVLKGARAEVHAVTPATRPAADGDGDGENADAGLRHFYLVDVTIIPTAATDGGFGMWEPGELRLIDARKSVSEDDAEGDDVADIEDVELYQDGAWLQDEGMKYTGPQRLRLTVGVVPDSTTLQFQYYFEAFGQVRLPRVIEGSAVA